MGITVAEALSKVYRLEAQEQARKKEILKSLDELEGFVKNLDEKDLTEYKSYGIDLMPLVSVNFNELRNDVAKRKDYVDLVNKTVDAAVKFVEEYS